MSVAGIQEFKCKILKAQDMPDELQKLYDMQYGREESDEYCDPLEATMHYLLEPGEEYPLLDGSYLSEDDLKDPDTASNVKATEEMFKMITFVVQNDDSDLIGYWHGPQGTPLESAPIVKYDTEGQFSLLRGSGLSEAMLGEYAYDNDEEFTEYKEWFGGFGIEINAGSYDELACPEGAVDPHDLHRELYNKNRVTFGLEPV